MIEQIKNQAQLEQLQSQRLPRPRLLQQRSWWMLQRRLDVLMLLILMMLLMLLMLLKRLEHRKSKWRNAFHYCQR